MKAMIGVLVALAAVGGAYASTRAVNRNRLASARTAANTAATTARERAGDALRMSVKAAENRVAAVGTLSPLVGQLALLRHEKLEGAVAKTLDDSLTNEPYFEPFRKEFPVYGLSTDGDKLGLVHGMQGKELAAEMVVRRARAEGLASDIVVGGGWPYAAGAVRVTVPSMTAPPILLLARPIDDAALKEAADRAGGAVLLTDGKKVLSQSGPRAEVDRLATVIGKEVAGAAVIDPTGDWGAGVTPIAPGVWLWAFASSPANTSEAETSATTSKAIVWSAAALLSMVALFFGLRRAPAAPEQSVTAIGMSAAQMTGLGRSAPVLPTTNMGSTGYGATLHAAGAVPAAVIAPGATFGRYTLLDRLGEGGMAQVFTAVTFGAEGFRRKFVVKRLRPELSADQSVVAQFIDEANLASTLVHSNVIPVFDFGKVGDEYFLATEYILGRDLGRVVKRLQEKAGHALPADIVLHCAHETLKALEYAHTKTGEAGTPLGIVHRDVSPNNVLVSARGEVKLFDFGIVKAEGRVTKTEHGVVKGNVSFMSPEQARGGNVDARADLFSLGLVMYYCLTGDVLYHGNTTYELLVKAATGPGNDELPRIRALPSPAAAIVAKALSVDPNGRYQSAREFAATIAPHVGQASADLQALMTHLFADDFKSEEKLFASAAPTTDTGSPLPASPGTGARRS